MDTSWLGRRDGTAERVLFDSDRFQRRLDHALSLVALALAQARQPYIAFSGGKDSICLAALVHSIRPDVPLVWSDDELEYPEVVGYMTTAQMLEPTLLTVTLGWSQHAGWFWPWQDTPHWREPLPGTLRIEQPVDDWQAGHGYDLTFTGLRADENAKRRAWLLSQGPLYRVSSGCGLRCCPLADWTADDVWALICGWNLPYPSVYDRLDAAGVTRGKQRVGPLPLAPRHILDVAYPDMLARLEARYGRRWM